jgi:hypothetical protein
MMNDKPSEIDLQLYAQVENSPVGTWKMFSAEGVGVEERIEQHLASHRVVREKISSSAKLGCYVETISLRLQVIDYWLRIYYVNKVTVGRERKREFGALLEQCRKLGFDETIVKELKIVNSKRIDAIHGFVIGSIAYVQLEAVADSFDRILKKTVQFVVRNCGTVVASREDLYARPGAAVLHVEGFCCNVEQGLEY